MAEHRGVLVDREYACIFKLDTPRDCSDSATTADPTLADSCDCQPPNPNTGAFTPDADPGGLQQPTPTQQDSAKAYPTIRELELAQLLGKVTGANEGIISSLCPIHTQGHDGDGTDPLYGYRPAMNAIINKLSNALSQPVPAAAADGRSEDAPGPVPHSRDVPGPPGSNGVPEQVRRRTGQAPT